MGDKLGLKDAIDNIDKTIEEQAPIHAEALDDYFETIDEKNLVEQAQGAINELHLMIRQEVLENGRIDVLLEEVLGYTLETFHHDILNSQNQCITGGKQMTLAFRGAGKSTVGTIGRIVYEILKNPDIRILIASNTQLQADVFLREIKEHFAQNETFINIFGNYVGPKWTSNEIVVSTRTKIWREATVTCIGVGGPTAGRHYDLILADDVADEENSRTEHQRERVLTWFYKSLMPTLMTHGRLLMNGTRWHPQDLYDYLLKNDPDLVSLLIPLLTSEGTSQWEEMFPIDKVIKMRREYGIPVFETQYQMNTASMEGKIFSYDSFYWYDVLPENIVKYGGADLAISMKQGADYFAFCTIGVDTETNKKYVIDIHRGRKKFQEQTNYMLKEFFKHDHIRIGVESNAYQGAQLYTLQDKIGKNRAVPVYTMKDKRTRAMKLAAKCENEEIYFSKKHMDLIGELIQMPDGDHDDLFDALEIAYSTATSGARKKRKEEPGLL